MNVRMTVINCCLIVFVNFIFLGVQGQLRRPVNVTLNSVSFIGEYDRVEFGGEFKPINRFLGIPYALPPVGDRRFARPEPVGVLATPFNATYHRPHCLQTVPLYYKHLQDKVRSEDCLYLNVYVPGEQVISTSKLPVMVYIHGGSFALGGSDIYSGDRLSAFNDVITVTINFRLNVFEFLSNGTKSAGNFGLWDTKLALQWIHDNIEKFGGDRKKVTLFGNSSGGSQVLLMAWHTGNRGLFERIIAQSGTPIADWAFQKEPNDMYVKFTRDNGCEFSDYKQTIACLRGKPAADLQVSSWDFLPSLDYDFLQDEPAELLKGSSVVAQKSMKFFAELDLINGVTSKDGALYYQYWKTVLGIDSLADGLTSSQFEDLFTHMMNVAGVQDCKAVREAIEYVYSDWSNTDDPKIRLNKMIDLQSDLMFFVPAVEVSRKHSSYLKNEHLSTNYMYEFAHKPQFVPEPGWLNGSIHTMEVAYLLGLDESMEKKLVLDMGGIDPFVISEADIKLSEELMVMWTNFAKTGNPNVPVELPDAKIPIWPEFDNRRQKYLTLEMNMTDASIKHHLAEPRVAFWTTLFPVLKQTCEKKTISQVSSANMIVLPYCFEILLVLLIMLMLL